MKRDALYPVNVRVERETVRELRQEAKLRKVSPSALIRQLLRASLLWPPSLPVRESWPSSRQAVPLPPRSSPKLASVHRQA